MARVVFKQVSKRFPGVQALTEVSLEIPSGSCQALIGENGAGKSTLGKILAGVHTADLGDIFLDDQRIAPASPLEARRLGIAMVHWSWPSVPTSASRKTFAWASCRLIELAG